MLAGVLVAVVFLTTAAFLRCFLTFFLVGLTDGFVAGAVVLTGAVVVGAVAGAVP